MVVGTGALQSTDLKSQLRPRLVKLFQLSPSTVQPGKSIQGKADHSRWQVLVHARCPTGFVPAGNVLTGNALLGLALVGAAPKAEAHQFNSYLPVQSICHDTRTASGPG